MDHALWLLIGLQLRGWMRLLGRGMRSPKGLLFALFGVIVFIPWLMLVVTPQREGIPAEKIRSNGPVYLLVYCLLNVLLSGGERAVYFSPSEVTFLFTGPFSRRQLLGYKVILTLIFTLPTTLFLTAVSHAHSPWLLATIVGVVLMTAFMQLFGMAINMAAGSIGARAYTKARRLVLVAIVVVGLVLFRYVQENGGAAVLDSAAWRTLTAPLRWFFDAFLAENWFDLLRFAALGLLVNLALLGVVFGLDADYLEAAAAYSTRVYAQIQRLRGGPSISSGSDGPSQPSRPRRSVPMPPNYGGIGPVVWRQLTTAVRSPGKLIGLVIAQALFTVTLFGGIREGAALEPVMGLAALLISMLLTPLLSFDFRGDLDRLEALKTMPLSPWRLALGQILVPALILSASQWLLLIGAGVYDGIRSPSQDVALSPRLPMLLAGAVIVVPFNFLLFGIENVLFLLAPTRQVAGTPLDFQAMGRNIMGMMAKMLVLGSAGAGAFVVGSLVLITSNGSVPLAVAAACLVLAIGGAVMVPVAALAFDRIDVTRDKPA